MDENQKDDGIDPDDIAYFGTDSARADLNQFKTEIEVRILDNVQEYLALGLSPYELMHFLRSIIDLS